MLRAVSSRSSSKSKRNVTPVVPMAERILEGASRAFGKQGYAAVRVEDILLESGISRPTFYKLYATKEEVFQILSERHHKDVRDRIRGVVMKGAVKGGNPHAQLSAILETFFAWRASLGPIGRVLDVEARTPGSVIAAHRRRTLDEMSALVNRLPPLKGRTPVDPVFIVALIAALESVADSLLSARRVDAKALARAQQIALRLIGGAIGAQADELAPLPRRRA
jgi:AcrR family transcriptional regulator